MGAPLVKGKSRGGFRANRTRRTAVCEELPQFAPTSGSHAMVQDTKQQTESHCRNVYHRMRAASAAIPGPSAVITPQSPGFGLPLRTTSSRTNITVADDMFP